MENDKNVSLFMYTTLKRTAITNKVSVNMFNLMQWMNNPTGSITDIETRKTQDSKSVCERTLIP